MLGSAESVGGFTDLFSPLEAKARLFRRNTTPRSSALEFPTRHIASTAGDAHGYPTRADRRQPAEPGRSAPAAAVRAGRACWSTAPATSSTSAGAPASISNPPPARPTGTSTPWRAKACAHEIAHGPAQGAAQRRARWSAAACASAPTAARQIGRPDRATHRGAAGPARHGHGGVHRCRHPAGDAAEAAPRRSAQPADLELEQALAQTLQETQAMREEMQSFAGGTQVGQRGTAIHQRGTAIDQRGADHLQGGDAVPQRGTADRECRTCSRRWTNCRRPTTT